MKERRCHCSDKHKHYRCDASQPPAANPWKSCRGRAAIWSRIFILQLQAPSGAGCVCLCFCSSPASCSSAVSTRPPSSRQTRGTQPRCHSAAQAPQWLRFPLGLTEVFAVFHIVGIQHHPVYWSPCGSSLSLPSSSFLSACFSPFPQHTFFIWCVYPPFTQRTHTAHLWSGILAYIRQSTVYISRGVNHNGQYEVEWLLLSFITKTITCSNE